jgi:hypothetical protein
MSRNRVKENRIIIIGCVAAKLDRKAPASELYVSPLFRKRRAYAEGTGLPWGIFSAHYGLLWPEQEVEPYEQRMQDLPLWKRESLGRGVGATIRHEFGFAQRFPKKVPALRRGVEVESLVLEVHAGISYVEALEWEVASAAKLWGWTMETPLARLPIGRQLAWYGRAA